MAKVFTISPGLENMGALKTGGQGSVYKGRRIGEYITAIKLLPTPIYSESDDNKSFRDFRNEVQKLKKVNELPNPNIVKILSSGLSETGNFPYIEMEYVEGPDLEELLQPPHPPVFTIKEVIKVAEQLSNALAQCHTLNVKHGDIKSNNVKFNLHTGNYVLLDFGPAIMSDEQRRSSLRNVGAVEFMAPEQNEGQMLFETDVYSLGVIIFELLAGTVPFPLNDKGETARNAVRLSHMETLPPDVVTLRAERLPASWPLEKREREKHVPEWLVNLVNKCLKKRPSSRFKNGVELYEYIIQNKTNAGGFQQNIEASLLQSANNNLHAKKEQLKQRLLQYKQQLTETETELNRFNALNLNESQGSMAGLENAYNQPTKGFSKSSFFLLLLLTVALACIAGYSYYNQTEKSSQKDVNLAAKDSTPATPKAAVVKPAKKERVTKKKAKVLDSTSVKTKTTTAKNTQKTSTQSNGTDANGPADNASGKYEVISKAYFYNSPDESTRRNAFIVKWNNAILSPSDEMNGFVYIVFKNVQGQTSRGWIRKSDLRRIK